jgi:hypothetical protein
MTDRRMEGRSINCRSHQVFAGGVLKGFKLAVGKGDQEGFQKNNGLPQAGIEIIVASVNFVPERSGINIEAGGEPVGGLAEILTNVLNHFLKSADLMEKLKAVREQHTIQQATHAGRSLASMAPVVRRVQRGGIGDGAIMPGVLGQGPK